MYQPTLNGPPPLPPRSPRPPSTPSEPAPRCQVPPPIPPRPPGYEIVQPSCPPVTVCIDAPVTFSTDWYHHPEAREFHICSRCYVDHIQGSRFAHFFHRDRPSEDAEARSCRFSKPRMKDHLFNEALASGSLGPVISWMRRRPTIPDCKGLDGVKGDVAATLGSKWLAAGIQLSSSSWDAPVNFLACEACYEDYLLPGRFARHFDTFQECQPADAVWSCDVAIPYVRKTYEKKSELDDWHGFMEEAKARMMVPPCPGLTEMVSRGRNWFVPKGTNGSGELILCQACFCDEVLHSGEEERWELSQELSRSFSNTYKVCCARGSRFNIRMLFGAAHDRKDFTVFWDALNRLSHTKACEPGGIVDGAWYTLPSHPKEFGVCAACFVAILEPMRVSRFFVPVDVTPGEALLCCLNRGHPKSEPYFTRLFEMYLTLDSAPLETYASEYGSVPKCPRDEDVPNRLWYGWPDCSMCPECYLDFARNSPLAEMMDLRDTFREENTSCELYSPRMRKLYTQCSTATPPNPQALLEYSVHRRKVYLETVPRIRMMIFQQRLEAEQARFMGVMGSHYTSVGQMQQTMYGTHYTYGAPGVGYGFANMDALQGARYNREAAELAAGVGMPSRILAVGELERRWREVE